MKIENSELFNKIEEILIEDILEVEKELKRNNEKYQALCKDNTMLQDKYPNVRNIFEATPVDSLNKEECDAILRIINNQVDQKILELEESFFKGIKETYFLFARVGIFKID